MQREIPGAVSPWPDCDQLLLSQERFHRPEQSIPFLWVPTGSARLSALLFAMQQARIPYCLGEEDTDAEVEISTRGLSQFSLDPGAAVAHVQAGVMIRRLNEAIQEAGYELGCAPVVWSSEDYTAEQLFRSGQFDGSFLGNRSPWSRVIGLEWMAEDGTTVKEGATLCGGPFLSVPGRNMGHRLVTQFTIEMTPKPQARRYCCWKLNEPSAAWQCFDELAAWTESWERLDVVVSDRKSFVFAEISGYEEEMEAFDALCPQNGVMCTSYELPRLQGFLATLPPPIPSTGCPLKGKGYYWYHHKTNGGWWWSI